MIYTNSPLIIGGGATEEDLKRWENVNKMLKHSVGVYDNKIYDHYKANVTDNGDGTMNIDMVTSGEKDYITETTINGNYMSINTLNIRSEE